MKRFSLLFILGTIALLGCNSAPQGNPFGEHPQSVHVALVESREMPLYLEVMGRVDSPLKVAVKAQIQGKLLAMHVPQGGEVKEGDLLFTIDPSSFQARVDQAMATLKKDESVLTFAKAKLERYKPLIKQDYVSQLHYDQLLSEIEGLTAQTRIDQAILDESLISLGYCSVRASMDGKLSQSHADPGNLVCPNDAIPLTELRQLDPIDVRFSLPQKDFQTIKANHRDMKLTAAILLPGETTPQHSGEVYFIDNHLDLGTGTLLCKAKVDNRDRSFWPGEYVRVRLVTKTIPEAMLVPLAAVQLGQEGFYLYVVQEDETVQMRPIDVLARVDGMAVLREGVKGGERVVVDGQINLRPGGKVKLIETATPKEVDPKAAS